MTLVSELKPFEKELTLWKERGALPQGEVKERLISIYKSLQAVKPGVGSANIPKGCSSCIGDMMKALYNNLNECPTIHLLSKHTFAEESNVEEVKKNASLNPAKPKDLDAKSLDYSGYTFPQLKKLCAQRGIKFKITDKKVDLAKLLMLNQA